MKIWMQSRSRSKPSESTMPQRRKRVLAGWATTENKMTSSSSRSRRRSMTSRMKRSNYSSRNLSCNRRIFKSRCCSWITRSRSNNRKKKKPRMNRRCSSHSQRQKRRTLRLTQYLWAREGGSTCGKSMSSTVGRPTSKGSMQLSRGCSSKAPSWLSASSCTSREISA